MQVAWNQHDSGDKKHGKAGGLIKLGLDMMIMYVEFA